MSDKMAIWNFYASPVFIQQLWKVIVIGKGALIFGPSTTENENTPSNRRGEISDERRADSKSKYLRSPDWGHTHMHAHTHVRTPAHTRAAKYLVSGRSLYNTRGDSVFHIDDLSGISRERLRDTRASGVSLERAIPIAYAGGLISHNLALACLRIGIGIGAHCTS